MELELKQRLRELDEGEQRQIAIIVQYQGRGMECRNDIKQLSKRALEWLVDFETGLIEGK